MIIITDPNPICLPLTRTRRLRLSPKLVSEIASAATASRNQPTFRLVSTRSDLASVRRSMTITLTRTAMARAASRLQGSRSARVGPGTDKLVGIMGQNTPAMLRNLWSVA